MRVICKLSKGKLNLREYYLVLYLKGIMISCFCVQLLFDLHSEQFVLVKFGTVCSLQSVKVFAVLKIFFSIQSTPASLVA